jgi:hypothetical protein
MCEFNHRLSEDVLRPVDLAAHNLSVDYVFVPTKGLVCKELSLEIPRHWLLQTDVRCGLVVTQLW